MTITVYGLPAPLVFGRLTVVGDAGVHITPNGSKFKLAMCRCVCGKEKTVRFSELTRKNRPTVSCGCLKTELDKLRKPPTKLIHGRARRGSSDYLYAAWEHIKGRCLNPSDKWFHAYGARGISIYSGWINDPEAFCSWILSALGPRPERHSLDRIDNDGNYEPGNLRWATPKQQSMNQRPRARRLA